MYGKSYKNRRTNRGRTYRAGGRTGRSMVKRAYAPKRTSYGRRTVTRSIKRETKYMDDYYNLGQWQGKNINMTGTNGSGSQNWVLGGFMKNTGLTVGRNNTLGTAGSVITQVNDAMPNCLTNIGSGTTANSRIGNVVEPRYISVKGVVCAATTNDVKDPETTFKTDPGDTDVVVERYCRTSVRVMIVRDKSMNEQGFINFTDMFAAPAGYSDGDTDAFLWNRKIETMNRYEILKQGEWTLDQDDPQGSFNWTIGLGGKQIRYNGAVSGKWRNLPGNTGLWNWVPDATAAVPLEGSIVLQGISSDTQSMTNGIYILAVATTVGNGPKMGQSGSPSMMFSTRCGFYDN